MGRRRSVVSVIVIILLAALAALGWGALLGLRVALKTQRAVDAVQEQQIERLLAQLADERARNLELGDRMTAMKREQFIEPAPLPEPRAPLAPEIEAFIADLPLELQGETRMWAYEQMNLKSPPSQILQELEDSGDMVEREIQRHENG